MASEHLVLRIEAPFAACRPFVAGWYRPTAGFLTHSAVYGLLLNVAGIESRLWEHDPSHDGRTPASLTRGVGLPRMRVALGLPAGAEPPRVETIYQQLHNYPQDNTKLSDRENPGKKIGKLEEGFRRCKGNKFNITPVRREVLCDLRAVVALECASDFAAAFRQGLTGEHPAARYGLPFLGDNSFLPDRLELPSWPVAARWYERIAADERGAPKPGVTRMTTWIDRADMSRTRSALYAPCAMVSSDPSDAAWTDVGPPAD